MKMNAMKWVSLLGCMFGVMFGRADDVLDQFLAECRAPAGSEVELGVWNGDLDACKKVADENGIPMIAIWSNAGCAHCKVMERALLSETFREWAKDCGMVLAFTCSLDPKGQRKGTDPGGSNNTIGTGTGSYKAFCKRPNGISNYPHVRFYWYENGKKVVDYSVLGDTVDNQTSKDPGSNPATYNKAGQVVIDYILQKSGFGAYTPKSLVKYTGGSFSFEETEGNRLEVEDGTSSISFELIREGAAAEVKTNNLVSLVGPDGKEAAVVNVEWTANQTNQMVAVDVSKVSFTENGQQASIIIKDAEGNGQATNHVTYVTGNSAYNPLWTGERRAVDTKGGEVPVLEYGEWTMDIDVAKAKVAAAEGDAYTLVAIEGSLWCHDCANTERNFTGVKDAKGNNRFAEWAKSNNVALVSIDIPDFNTNSVECASPTLLSRTPYSKVLAYELPSRGMYDVSLGGADPSLTNAMMRSGLGYLTRKGVSDAEALVALSNNYNLVSTNTDKGGFHRPEDKYKYRTNVPIFVMLRKDGTVAARLTDFGVRRSPMADFSWDNAIKRFDEMLEIAKAKKVDDPHYEDIENNDATTTPCSFKANGGSGSGEISHADFQDVFKLEGVGGNALQKVTVTGAVDAVVSVQFMKLNAEGKSVAVGTAATGKLSEGVALEETFAEAGDFFVKVSGGDIAAGSFAVDNAKAGNFAAFEISGDVVLVPQESKASGSAPEDSDKVVMRLEKDQMYRIEGVDPTNAVVAAVLAAKTPDDPYCKFYTALTSGDVEVVSAYGKGGSVAYQKWVPCKVGFVEAAKTVTESVGKVSVAIARTDGSSGDVKIRVSLDEDATTLYNSEDEPRFAPFEPVEFTWADGKMSTTNVTIEILDDKRFDGIGDVALKLELVSDENGDTVLTTTNYVLSVTEDDKQSAGKVAFTGAEPFFSKKATVYARESDGATIYAERIEASDGYVTVKLNVSNGAKTEVGGVETNVLVWANHKADPQAVKVSGISAGKSAKVTLASPTDGLAVLAASNAVTVVAVADDAPAFAQSADSKSLYRYVSTSNVYPVVFADGVDAAAATLAFTKLSGTLPAGLAAKYDAAAQALVISGTPTKVGDFTMVYQVSQKVGGKTTPGLAIELTYSIADPTAGGGEALPYNAAVAAVKSRTFKDIPVIDKAAKRLMGVVQVTIPQTGKASAKYICHAGAIPFSAKGWSGFAADGDRALTASLTSSKSGYAMTLVANNDGSVDISVATPGTGGGDPLVASCEGGVWSKDDNASTWQGYYTVAMMNDMKDDSVVEADGYSGIAPRGNGYLTLKMNTSSAVNSGTVTWAGLLPNGTAVSGSAVLGRDEECDGVVSLPVFKSSSTDVLAALVELCDSGRVLGDEDAGTYWSHIEKYEATTYDVKLNAYGNLYSATTNLAEACMAGYSTTTPVLSFDVAGLGGWFNAGTPVHVEGVTVTVGEKTLTVAKGNQNPIGATLGFDRSKGVVTGSFKLPYTTEAGETKTVSATYKGVVLLDFGPGCGCGDDDPERPVLPFVTGAFYTNDKVKVNNGKKDVQINVKRGGGVSVDAAE